MVVRASAELFCSLFLWNDAMVLELEIRAVLDDEFYRGLGPQVSLLHPVNGDIGVSACEAVGEHKKSSEMLQPIWNTAPNDDLQLFFGRIQIWSAKSQTLLNADGLTFYPLHMKLLRFSEWMEQLQILSGATVLRHLLVAFHSNPSDTIHCKSRFNDPS